MIQANELRLNNWVNINGSNIQLNDTWFLYFFQEADGKGLNERFQPIPLTPEILEKCRFDELVIYGDKVYRYRNLEIIKSNFGIDQDFTMMDNIATFHPRIKFLHQLQNLYFALTETELEIKL